MGGISGSGDWRAEVRHGGGGSRVDGESSLLPLVCPPSLQELGRHRFHSQGGSVTQKGEALEKAETTTLSASCACMGYVHHETGTVGDSHCKCPSLEDPFVLFVCVVSYALCACVFYVCFLHGQEGVSP